MTVDADYPHLAVASLIVEGISGPHNRKMN
jgi:hypothetical protein